MNATERATRFGLSATLALVALLMDFIAKDVKFDITIHGASERVDNYAQFVSLTWIFAGMALIAFAWSFQAIFTRKEQEPETTEWSETW
jgi:hypothetical protein